MKINLEKSIVESWLTNGDPWIKAIRNNEIESRTLVTNKAIVIEVLSRKPQSVLDIGCGEGWLARELSTYGIKVIGIDTVPELIDEANKIGGATFHNLSYEEIFKTNFKTSFDLLVCNFSLFGNESVRTIFENAARLLSNDGFFIIQTIHPIHGCGKHPYKDGWREGSWTGFNTDFKNPAPWYFRTLESWKLLFSEYNIELIDIKEPINPLNKSITSIIFTGKVLVQ